LKFGYSFDHSNHNPTNKAGNRCNDGPRPRAELPGPGRPQKQ